MDQKHQWEKKQDLQQSQDHSLHFQELQKLPQNKNLQLTFSNNNKSYLNYSEQYNNYIEYLKPLVYQPNSQCDIYLNPIIYNTSFRKQISINKMKQNDDSCVIEVFWGHFSMEISLLRVMLEGKNLHGDRIAGNGAYSQTFFASFNKIDHVIKSIDLTKTLMASEQQIYGFNPKISALIPIISEYFLTKVASIHKIAPKVINLFGYDIIIYNDCADIVLEKCVNLRGKNTQIQQMENQMKQNLRILHSLRICHRDIKPNNIMWSQSLNKPVFIDFGLAQMVSQNIGQKTLSSFVGTYLFCGDQMKQAYLQKHNKFIDLYYNDLQSLKNTFKHQKKRLQKDNNINQPQNVYEMTCSKQPNLTQRLINLFCVKLCLFVKDYEGALKLIYHERHMVKSIKKIFIEQFTFIDYPADKILLEKMIKTKTRLNELKNQFHKFDILLSQYLTQYYDNRKILNIPGLQFSNKEDFITFCARRSNIQKILYLLDPMKWNSQIKNIRSKFLKKISLFYQGPNFLQNKKTDGPQSKSANPSTSLLIHYILHNFLIPNLKKQKDKTKIIKLRYISMFIQDYSTCYEIQQFILNSYQQQVQNNEQQNIVQEINKQQLIEFYIQCMLFFVQRRAWFSTEAFCSDRKRYLQAKNKNVGSNKELILLKKAAQILLSSDLTYKGIISYQKVNEILIEVYKSLKVSVQLLNQIQQIKRWCKLLTQSKNTFIGYESQFNMFFISLLTHIQCKQIINQQPLMPDKNKQIVSNGYIGLFIMFHQYQQISQSLVNQFIYIASRNDKIYCSQLQRFICNQNISNTQLKIIFIQTYILKVKIEEDYGWLQMVNVLNTIVNGMNQLMLYFEKPLFFPHIKVSLKQDFIDSLFTLYCKIQDFFQFKNLVQHQQHKPLMIIAQYQLSYLLYLTTKNSTFLQIQTQQILSNHKFYQILKIQRIKIYSNFELLTDQFIKNIKKIVYQQQSANKLNYYSIGVIVTQLKILYIKLYYTKAGLKEILRFLLVMYLKNVNFSYILSILNLFSFVLSFSLLQKPQDSKYYFQLFLDLIIKFYYFFQPLASENLIQLYIYQSSTKISQASSLQIISEMIPTCLVISYSQFRENYFLSLLIFQIYTKVCFFGRQLNLSKKDLTRLNIVSTLGAQKTQLQFLRYRTILFSIKEFRKLNLIKSQRKDIRLLRIQISHLRKQAAKELLSIAKQNIFEKRRYKQKLKEALEQKILQKFANLKENIKGQS